jgi:hypothetical protein
MKELPLIRILVVALTVISCELLVTVDVPVNPPRLVLNGLITSDSGWAVMLTRERHILDGERDFALVENATVNVTDLLDGAVIPLSYNGYGKYRSPTTPVSGKQYQVNVTAPAFAAVNSTTEIPDLVPITNVTWDSAHAEPADQFGRIKYPFEITFKDQPGKQNYYSVTLTAELVNNIPTGPNTTRKDTATTSLFLESEDPLYERGNFGIFNDTFFSGETRTIRFKVQSRRNTEVLRAYLVLTNFSEDFYRYHATSQLQHQVGFDPFSQPVKIYNNIEGGLGIFAGATSSVVEWKMGD